MLLLALAASSVYSTTYAGPTPADAVRSLLARQLGAKATSLFELESCAGASSGLDAFELAEGSAPGSVTVRGSTTSSLASGVLWYLKYTANASVSWGVDGTGDNLNGVRAAVKLPAPKPLRVESKAKWRYYMNVCTVSYSMAWWDWARWERELDWAALNGVNLPLAFTGQELIWEKTFLKLGLNATEIEPFFAGPAFLAWERMGNMRGWGGPLPRAWREKQSALQLKILQRMRELGMTPVLPAFSGHVPLALARLTPNVIASPNWWTAAPQYCCDGLLKASDPLFPVIGQKFIETMREEWAVEGDGHVYNGDTFNEMDPPSFAPADLAPWGGAVYEGIHRADPEGTWMLQGWLFFASRDKWTPAAIAGYLSEVPVQKTLVLDLFSDVFPEWQRSESFAGRPWIWNMLENFGGRRYLTGNLTRVATGPALDAAAAKPGTFAGVGVTPEAIENNPVMFDMLYETAWRAEPAAVEPWVRSYAERRYGFPLHASAAKAWSALVRGPYSAYRPAQNPVEVRPTLDDVNICEVSIRPGVACPGRPDETAAAWRHLLDAATDAATVPGPMRYDLVDVGRQAMANAFGRRHALLRNASTACALGNATACDAVGPLASQLIGVVTDTEALAASDANFLLGSWIEAARAWGDTDAEKALYEFNAKNQLTWWGPGPGAAGYRPGAQDYAAKPWAGLILSYYRPRWTAFLSEVVLAAGEKRAPDLAAANAAVNAAEIRWMQATGQDFPTKAEGDTLEISRELAAKYPDFM